MVDLIKLSSQAARNGHVWRPQDWVTEMSSWVTWFIKSHLILQKMKHFSVRGRGFPNYRKDKSLLYRKNLEAFVNSVTRAVGSLNYIWRWYGMLPCWAKRLAIFYKKDRNIFWAKSTLERDCHDFALRCSIVTTLKVFPLFGLVEPWVIPVRVNLKFALERSSSKSILFKKLGWV